MAKSQIFFLVGALNFILVVLSLMGLASPARGDMGVSPERRPMMESFSGFTEFEDAQAENFVAAAQFDHERTAKVVGSKEVMLCAQSDDFILNLLLPCLPAATDPMTVPSELCCSGMKTVTDVCFCYLENFVAMNFFLGLIGPPVDDALRRVAVACDRSIPQC